VFLVVPIPSVDRGRGDPGNILDVILAVVNGQYTIGCPSGILKGKYSRHQFDLCPQRLLSESDINSAITQNIIFETSTSLTRHRLGPLQLHLTKP
jgi:hypothetical protein